MNELIKIEGREIGSEQVQTVNARDLHVFLEVSKDFSDWIKVQIHRARLVEGRDYCTSQVSPRKGENSKGGRPTTEYYLTTEAGKHVAMMSGSDKGFEVRDYFIECEKVAKSKATSYSSFTASIPTSQTDTVTAIMSLGKMVGETPGVKIGIATAVALDCVQQMTGIPTEQFRRLLPAATAPICSHNATQLGKLVGKSAQAMNQELLACGLQHKNARNEWELTKAGEEWGEAMPFARRGHTGYQILWNPDVLSQVLSIAA